MKRPAIQPRHLATWLMALGAMAGLVAASHAPWRAHPERSGVLRLNLSGRPARIERCRTLSEEELAARPAHMRQAVVCEGEAARYRLRVASGKQILIDIELSGGGARRDRPMHFLREFPLAPGRHHLSVRMSRLGERDTSATAATSIRRSTEVLPIELGLDTILTIASHRVVMVTYDPGQQRLLALTGPRTP